MTFRYACHNSPAAVTSEEDGALSRKLNISTSEKLLAAGNTGAWLSLEAKEVSLEAKEVRSQG